MDNMQQVHEMWEMLMNMGATKEDCIKLLAIAVETANKIVNEA